MEERGIAPFVGSCLKIKEKKMKTHQLISSYHVELIEPPCHPGAAAWSVKAGFQDDIIQVLPYLNSELKEADYNAGSKVLIWDSKGEKCAFRPCEIVAAPVETREEGKKIIDELINMVNLVWERRENIEPDFKQKKIPTLMDIYKLLPKTNCKECGYPTCMAYAADVRTGIANASQCPDLSGTKKDSVSALFN